MIIKWQRVEYIGQLLPSRQAQPPCSINKDLTREGTVNVIASETDQPTANITQIEHMPLAN